MKTKKESKGLPANFVYSKRLDNQIGKSSFPEKVAQANNILKKHGGLKLGE